MHKTLLIYFVLLYSAFLQAQTAKIDSLKKVLHSCADDSNKVNILNRLCYALRDDSTCLLYFDESIQLATKLKFMPGIINAFNHIGLYYKNRGDFKKALEYHSLSLSKARQMHDLGAESRSYNNIAIVYLSQADYPRALDFHYRSLKLKIALQDKEGEASSYNNIGAVYHHLGELNRSLSTMRRRKK